MEQKLKEHSSQSHSSSISGVRSKEITYELKVKKIIEGHLLLVVAAQGHSL